MPVTTGKFTGLTVTELERLILWEVGQVSGTTVSYSKFPRWLIRSKLNDRQNRVVEASKCIRKTAIIPAQDGRRTYRLPENCMDGGLISVKFFSAADEYEVLDLKDRQWLDENRDGWRVDEEDDPEIVFPGPSYGNLQTFSVHPVPDADGNSYYDSPDTGIYVGTDMPGTGVNTYGTCTALGSATTLTNSAGDFTNVGLVAGMAVINLTDGSVARLSSIAATALTMTAPGLTGGTDDTFASGDSYMILSGEYAVICDHRRADRYAFASEIGMLDNLTVPANSFLVDFLPYPLAFPFDPSATDANQLYQNMYPEIPRIYHSALVDGVVADLLGTFNEGSKEFARAQAYEQRFVTKASGSAMKAGRPFENPGASFVPVIGRR